MKVRIIPTILVSNFSEFKKRAKFLEKHFSFAQIDCADGKFVGNKTFYDAKRVSKVLKVNFELHLMVKDPPNEIKKWLKVKKLKSVIFHYEAAKYSDVILNIINCLHKKKIKVGLALNPGTKVEKIREFLPYLDEVLFLSVNPGWGGRKFMPKVLKKIRALRKLDKKIDIGVDGGVNIKNAKQIVRAGTNLLYAGKFLSDLNNIKKLKKNLGV